MFEIYTTFRSVSFVIDIVPRDRRCWKFWRVCEIDPILSFLLLLLSLTSCSGRGDVEFSNKCFKFTPFFLLLCFFCRLHYPGKDDVELCNNFLKFTHFPFSSAYFVYRVHGWDLLNILINSWNLPHFPFSSVLFVVDGRYWIF